MKIITDKKTRRIAIAFNCPLNRLQLDLKTAKWLRDRLTQEIAKLGLALLLGTVAGGGCDSISNNIPTHPHPFGAITNANVQQYLEAPSSVAPRPIPQSAFRTPRSQMYSPGVQ